MEKPQDEILEKLLERVNIVDWDALIVGDGSGTGWNTPCGWGGVLIDKNSKGRKLFYGGLSMGSINLAEMMPYFQSLVWYEETYGKKLRKRFGTVNVHIITDSQVTALHGGRTASGFEDLPKVPQRSLWAAMREFRALGYRIHWHWAERCDSGLNVLGDLVAGLARRSIKNIDPSVDLAKQAAEAIGNLTFRDPASGEVLSPYLINPSTEIA